MAKVIYLDLSEAELEKVTKISSEFALFIQSILKDAFSSKETENHEEENRKEDERLSEGLPQAARKVPEEG